MDLSFIRLSKNISLAAKGALAHCLQRRASCKIQNGHQGAPKWPTESRSGCTLGVLGTVNDFKNKLGLSCAKLTTAEASYTLATI